MGIWNYRDGQAKCMACGWIGEFEGGFPGELEHTCEPVEGVDPFFPDDDPLQTLAESELSEEDQERIARIRDRQTKLGQRKPCNCGQGQGKAR